MTDYPGFSFDITARDPAGSRARAGRYETPHGTFDTPAFIFCGTKAAVKAVTPAQVKEAGTSIILSNTYHLMLQPGADLVARMGGLHKFMGWDGPMLTDSGGFQVFSLGHGSVASEIKGSRDNARPPTLIKVSEEGAEFRSYIDGSRHTLTPESSIEIQQKLGADLIVVFDECTAFHDSRDYTAKSMELTHRWAKRCLTAFERGQESLALDRRQALYGIVQGGVYPDLRQVSAEFIDAQSFFGLAVGGSLGGSKGQMREVVGYTMAHLNGHRPCISWASAASPTSSTMCSRASTPSIAWRPPAWPAMAARCCRANRASASICAMPNTAKMAGPLDPGLHLPFLPQLLPRLHPSPAESGRGAGRADHLHPQHRGHEPPDGRSPRRDRRRQPGGPAPPLGRGVGRHSPNAHFVERGDEPLRQLPAPMS